MSKLSTAKLKEMIGTWMASCNKEVEEQVKYYSDYFKQDFPKATSDEELRDIAWREWCNGNRWKRVEKSSLAKSEGSDIFRHKIRDFDFPGYPKPLLRVEPDFPCDVCGDHNKELVQRYFDDPKLAEKCVYRMFIPTNELADVFRLEVITTHDDTEVVGWWVTVD